MPDPLRSHGAWITLCVSTAVGSLSVERGFVGCREIELAVLQGVAGGAPRVSLPGEIVVHDSGAFYDRHLGDRARGSQ